MQVGRTRRSKRRRHALIRIGIRVWQGQNLSKYRRNAAATTSERAGDVRVADLQNHDQQILAKKRSKRGVDRDASRLDAARPQEFGETTVLPFAYRYQVVLLYNWMGRDVCVSSVRSLVGNQDFAT